MSGVGFELARSCLSQQLAFSEVHLKYFQNLIDSYERKIQPVFWPLSKKELKYNNISKWFHFLFDHVKQDVRNWFTGLLVFYLQLLMNHELATYFGRFSFKLTELLALLYHAGVPLVILVGQTTFLSLFLDVMWVYISTVSFLKQLDSGIPYLQNVFLWPVT